MRLTAESRFGRTKSELRQRQRERGPFGRLCVYGREWEWNNQTFPLSVGKYFTLDIYNLTDSYVPNSTIDEFLEILFCVTTKLSNRNIEINTHISQSSLTLSLARPKVLSINLTTRIDRIESFVNHKNSHIHRTAIETLSLHIRISQTISCCTFFSLTCSHWLLTLMLMMFMARAMETWNIESKFISCQRSSSAKKFWKTICCLCWRCIKISN